MMRRHIILTSGRSGSSYLVDTINLHPEAVNYEEVLGSWTLPWKLFAPLRFFGVSTESYLEYIYSSSLFFRLAQLYSAYCHWKKGQTINYKKINDVKSVGIKDFFFLFEKRHVFEFVLKQSDMDVIYLHRSDLLRRCVSLMYMEASKIAFVEGNQLAVKKINIDVKKLREQLLVLEAEVQKEREMLEEVEMRGLRVLYLSYEDYFKNSESIVEGNKKIFKFLSLDPVSLESGHKKILPDNYSDIINNYAEFRDSLTGTQHEKYM